MNKALQFSFQLRSRSVFSVHFVNIPCFASAFIFHQNFNFILTMVNFISLFTCLLIVIISFVAQSAESTPIDLDPSNHVEEIANKLVRTGRDGMSTAVRLYEQAHVYCEKHRRRDYKKCMKERGY